MQDIGHGSESTAAIVARVRQVLDVATDAEVARAWGISHDLLCKWKRRDSRPYPYCLALARERGVSLVWLLTGEGAMRADAIAHPDPDPDPDPNPDRAPGLADGRGEYGAGADSCAGGLGRRLAALAGVLEGLEPAQREAILADAQSRATLAQRVAALEAAGLGCERQRKRGGRRR